MSKILVIDDNELLGKMLKEALTEQSYTVKVAMDANQGYADAIDFLPDLMLIDVQLPDVVGFDLIRIIKNRDDLQHIPIIMITGTAHKIEEKVKGFQMGADDYVLKPFEMAELIERIKAVLRRSAHSKTPPSSRGRMQEGSKPEEASPPSQPSPIKGEVDDKTLSLKQAIYKTLSTPWELSGTALPSVTMPYLAALLGLSLGGWVLSAGSTVKPALIGLGTAGFWGLCVSFLVMSCSIMGITLTWKEGARVICLAGLPLLLKLLGGFVTTLVTSLSPFYFTASPALFFKSAPAFLERLDVFELWMVWLVWVMVKQCRGSSKQKALVTAAVVWPILGYWQSLWKH